MDTKKNIDIRTKAQAAGVYLWQIAHELGVTDFTLSRRLRFELTPKEKLEAYQAIDAIVAEREKAGGSGNAEG